MLTTLYLRQDEKAFVPGLPQDLLVGITLEDETLTFNDTDKRRSLRFRLLRLTNPALIAWRDRLLAAKDQGEFGSILQTLDLRTAASSTEMTRLLYALGPDALSIILRSMILDCSSSEDLELILSIAGLRHLMLQSLVEAGF